MMSSRVHVNVHNNDVFAGKCSFCNYAFAFKVPEFAAWSNDEKYVSWDVHTSNTQSDQTTLLNTLNQSIYERVQLLSAGLVQVAVVGDQVEPGQPSLEEADAGVRDGVVGDVGVLHDVVGGDVDVAEDEGGKERSW